MDLIYLGIYLFEIAVGILVNRIPNVGVRYGAGIAGWAGGLVSLNTLFMEGKFGFSTKSATEERLGEL